MLRCSTEVCSNAAASVLSLKVTQGVENSIDVHLHERLVQFEEVVRIVFLSQLTK